MNKKRITRKIPQSRGNGTLKKKTQNDSRAHENTRPNPVAKRPGAIIFLGLGLCETEASLSGSLPPPPARPVIPTGHGDASFVFNLGTRPHRPRSTETSSMPLFRPPGLVTCHVKTSVTAGGLARPLKPSVLDVPFSNFSFFLLSYTIRYTTAPASCHRPVLALSIPVTSPAP